MRYSVVVFFFTLLTLSIDVSAQIVAIPDSAKTNSSWFLLEEIVLIGNKKTRANIILRELNFKEGDTIQTKELEQTLNFTKNRIFNTGLFTTVELHLANQSPTQTKLLILVHERLYIIPLPIFELADRNFNEWWVQRNHDIKRVNLGIFYTHKNMRGRNETLRAKFQLGFVKKFELQYFIPYLDKKQRFGLTIDLSNIINKQLAYKTSNNKLTYLDIDKITRDRFRGGFAISYRRKFYETHILAPSFNYNEISDTIAILNPNYLLKSRTHQSYLALKYSYIKDRRDIASYPLKGYYFRFDAEKMGLGIFHDINQLNLIGEYSIYKPLRKKLFFASGVKQKISFPHPQPYLQTRGLGYDNDYVSGYELYVIDGQSFSLAKLNLKWKLFVVNYPSEKAPNDIFTPTLLSVYLKTYSDAGYVVDNTFNPSNAQFSNKLLLGGGIGLDFVTYYDYVMRLEYSINKIGQTGVYLHFAKGI